MKQMIENFINGNLSDAKRQAKKYSFNAIFAYLRTVCGFSPKKSLCVARYLKTPSQYTFQQACDAL